MWQPLQNRGGRGIGRIDQSGARNRRSHDGHELAAPQARGISIPTQTCWGEGRVRTNGWVWEATSCLEVVRVRGPRVKVGGWGSWRCVSMDRSFCCCYRTPEFSSKHPQWAHTRTYSSSSRESDVLLQHPWGLHPRHAQIYTQAHTYKHIKQE